MAARILIADDHCMFRVAMERWLSSQHELLPGVSTIREAERAFGRGGFDVALIDLSWGIEGSVLPHLRTWARRRPESKLIVISAMAEWYFAEELFAIGVHGLIGKRSNFSEVLVAIETVLAGQRYLGDGLQPPPSRTNAGAASLPPIAHRILEFLSHGWLRKDIARALNVSIRTVDYHVSRIREEAEVAPHARVPWGDILVRFGTKRWGVPD